MPYDRRRPEAPPDRAAAGGGIPDGLLVAVLGLLLGITALTWTATGLSSLLAHSTWPEGVTFTRTPLAMRDLVTEPGNLPAAWPDTPAGALPRPGLFWGVLIGQILLLLVLGLFVASTYARWRAMRAMRHTVRETAGTPTHDTTPPAPEPRTGEPTGTTRSAPASPANPATGPHTGAVYGRARADRAADALRAAPGPALVVTADPSLWQDTAGGRAKLGPVHVYDPAHLTDSPVRLRWAPHRGCEDRRAAAVRAAALLSCVRSPAKADEAVHSTAETLLGCWLHAAAVAGEPFRRVHRWATAGGGSSAEAVRVLRTHPAAASGAAGDLEAALTAHPERRDAAARLVRHALACLAQLHVRDACKPSHTDTTALDSLVSEEGTLYVVGKALEDPRRAPGTMPLLTALTTSVVEHGRRMAAGSSAGRLDPPLTLVLDDVASVAPIPQLPELLVSGEAMGLPTLALMRSEDQARVWWPGLTANRPTPPRPAP